jgi:hypothetical protein
VLSSTLARLSLAAAKEETPQAITAYLPVRKDTKNRSDTLFWWVTAHLRQSKFGLRLESYDRGCKRPWR